MKVPRGVHIQHDATRGVLRAEHRRFVSLLPYDGALRAVVVGASLAMDKPSPFHP